MIQVIPTRTLMMIVVEGGAETKNVSYARFSLRYCFNVLLLLAGLFGSFCNIIFACLIVLNTHTKIKTMTSIIEQIQFQLFWNFFVADRRHRRYSTSTEESSAGDEKPSRRKDKHRRRRNR